MSQVREAVKASAAPDHPDLPLKPPLVFLLAAAIGVGAHHLWPYPARPAGWTVVGVALTVLAVALIQWSAWVFRRHETAVVPWKPSRVIVDSGPFAVSRNPIYVAFAIFQVGLGLWSNKLAVVLMVVPAVLATSVVIIAREEAYLERKFGAEYRAYKARVRRWV